MQCCDFMYNKKFSGKYEPSYLELCWLDGNPEVWQHWYAKKRRCMTGSNSGSAGLLSMPKHPSLPSSVMLLLQCTVECCASRRPLNMVYRRRDRNLASLDFPVTSGMDTVCGSNSRFVLPGLLLADALAIPPPPEEL